MKKVLMVVLSITASNVFAGEIAKNHLPVSCRVLTATRWNYLADIEMRRVGIAYISFDEKGILQEPYLNLDGFEPQAFALENTAGSSAAVAEFELKLENLVKKGICK